MTRIPRISARQGANGEVSVDEQLAELGRWMNRRRVTRRSALEGAFGGVGALALAGLVLPSEAAAATMSGVRPGSYHVRFFGRHIAYGPDPSTEMWVAVQTSARPPSRDGAIIVEYGPDRRCGGRAAVEVRDLVSHVAQGDGGVYSAQQWYLHALLRGLRPGRRYHYRWRLADGTLTPDAHFWTAPAKGSDRPFVFTAIADEGVNDPLRGPRQARRYPGERHAARYGFDDDYYEVADTRRSAHPAATLVTLIAADEPAFNLVGGDICYADPSGSGLLVDNLAPGRSHDDYDPFVWDAYLALIDKSAASSPWMFASGNHDMEMVYLDPSGADATPERDYQPHGYGGLLHRLDLGSNGPSRSGRPIVDPSRRSVAPTVYSFIHQNVAVLSIDANELSYEIPANLGYSGGAQVRWIADRLAAYRADPDIDFIVAFFHQCAYCTSETHGSDGGVRSVLDPLFSRYKVDLVFQGHNHQYERTDPIIAGQPTGVAPIGSTIYPDTQGTTYVVVGSGGRPRYAFSAPDAYAGAGASKTADPVSSFVTERGGATTPETVRWSRVRYSDYAYCRVEVLPAARGRSTTMIVTAVSDLRLPVDQFTLSRIAGAAAGETYGGPPAEAPEAPAAALLLPAAAAVIGGAWHHRRRRNPAVRGTAGGERPTQTT